MKMIPKLKKYISDKVFLWFEQPNRYLITDPLIYEIIKIYSTSENNTVFLDKVHHLTSLDIDQIDSIYRELDNQFKDLKKQMIRQIICKSLSILNNESFQLFTI